MATSQRSHGRFLKRFTKKVSSLLIVSIILSFLVVNTAFAASVYSVTQATATVGAHTSLEIEYTVDTADQTWANADTLTVTLPDNYPAWAGLTYTVEYDEDTTNDATAETAIEAGAGNGEYAVVGRVMTVKWNITGWGAVVDDASTIRVLITAAAIPTYADSTSTFTFGGTTAEAGDTNPTGTDDVNVSAADAAASLTLEDNAVVGTAGNTTLTLTTPIALANTDTVAFTAPANLDVSGVSFDLTTFGGGGQFACAASGQIVTCTADGAITAGTGNIVMLGIVAASVGSSQTISSVTVYDTSATANIATDASGTVTNTTVGDLTSTNVQTDTLVVSTGTDFTVSFTTTAAIPQGGKILITFPSGFSVTSASGHTASNLSGLTGTWTSTVSGQVVTLTQTGGSAASAGAKSLKIGSVMTPNTIGASSAYTITTQTGAGANIETDAAVSADTFVVSPVSSSSDSSSNSTTSTGTQTTTNTGTTNTTTTTTTTTTDTSGTTEEDKSTEDGITGAEPGASAEEGAFADVTTHWAKTMIEVLASHNVLKGNPDGTFRPENSLNRAEAAAVLYRVLGMEEPVAPTEKPFVDVDAGAWFAGYVGVLKAQNAISGNPDGTYRPGEYINRAEFLKMAIGVYEEMHGEIVAEKTDVFSDVSMDAWFSLTVSKGYAKGFVEGVPCGTKKCYNPGSQITRAEAAKILYMMFFAVVTDPL